MGVGVDCGGNAFFNSFMNMMECDVYYSVVICSWSN